MYSFGGSIEDLSQNTLAGISVQDWPTPVEFHTAGSDKSMHNHLESSKSF